MKRPTNNATRKYYHLAKHEVPLCYKQKKLYLNELTETLHTLLLENPDISYDAIVELLGTPEQQTKSYTELLSADELYQNIRTGKRISRYIIICTIFLTIILCSLASWIVIKKLEHTYIITIETDIIEETSTNSSSFINPNY